MKKHQALLTEVAGHEPRIHSVCDQGAQMIDGGHYAATDIQQKIDDLKDKWSQLTVSATRMRMRVCCQLILSVICVTRHYQHCCDVMSTCVC